MNVHKIQFRTIVVVQKNRILNTQCSCTLWRKLFSKGSINDKSKQSFGMQYWFKVSKTMMSLEFENCGPIPLDLLIRLSDTKSNIKMSNFEIHNFEIPYYAQVNSTIQNPKIIQSRIENIFLKLQDLKTCKNVQNLKVIMKRFSKK